MKKYNDLAAAILMAIAFVIFSAGSARAATYTVTNVNDSGAGSLREAVAAANGTAANDVIAFADSVFSSPRTIVLTGGELRITANGGLTINGTGADRLTVSSFRFDQPEERRRVFLIDEGANVVINGLSITNGGGRSSFQSLDGGGIYNNRATLTLNAVALRGNSAQSGGALFNNLGTVNIVNSTISGNSASDGGGIATFGAQVFGDPTTVNITNSTISGNGSSSGGGIFHNSGAVNLVNSTVSGNVAETAGSGGGGGVSSASFNFNVRNSIIANNSLSSGSSSSRTGPDFRGRLNSQGYNLIENTDGATISGDTTGNIYGVDPQLAALADNGGTTQTQALMPGSPAVDAANPNNAANPPTDQRGLPRPVDGDNDGIARADIGAFELGANQFVQVVTKTADTNDGNCAVDDCSLREAIAAANQTPGDNRITFAASVFGSQARTITLSGELTIASDSSLTINGTGANRLNISGNNNSRVFFVSQGANVNINNLAITNGNGAGAMSGSGGGIYNFRGTLTLNGVMVSGNRAINAVNNAVGFGGGIYNNFAGSLIITNSTISGNQARLGGGIANTDNGFVRITNSTVSGNSTTQFGGGGIENSNTSSVELANATVSNNTAQSDGGGVRNFGTVNSRNSIIADNTAATAPDFSGTLNSGGYNLIENTSGTTITGTTTGNILNQNPMLGSLQNNGGTTQTQALLSGSPAIDAADPNNAANPPIDQRGEARPFDGNGDGTARADIGAFEFNMQTGTTFTVTKAADTNDGNCTAADCSLREAIAAANQLAGDNTIVFAANVFNTAQTIVLTNGELVIANNGGLTVNGAGANRLTVSGNNLSRVFSIAAGATVNINNLTVTGGNGSGASGGGSGGGIYNRRATLTLNTVTVRNNTATFGGGIYNEDDSIVQEIVSKDENVASAETSENSVASPAVTGTVTLSNSTVNNNSATNGGGIYIASGTATLTNSTFSGNTASGQGGGIYTFRGTGDLLNSTVAGNSANTGGGIYNELGTINLRNTIVALNTAGTSPDIDGTFNSNGNNLIGGNPQLGPLQNNGGTTETRALLPGSPAINAGNNQAASGLTTDQRGAGFPRISGGTVDIGAFEVQLAPTAASVSVSGRVVTVDGRGLQNATVTLTDSSGNTRSARTTAFGYFRFDEVEVGNTYIFQVVSKRYVFAPQVISLNEELDELVFTAQSGRDKR